MAQISDGRSIFRLLNELFSLLALDHPPAHCSPDAPPIFRSLDEFLSAPLAPGSPIRIGPSLPLAHLSERLPSSHPHHALLPPASELTYPVLPLFFPSSSVPSTAPPSLARQRWFWAISRIHLVLSRQAFPRTHQLPRVYLDPKEQAYNRWYSFAFTREETTNLVQLSKENGLSPSA